MRVLAKLNGLKTTYVMNLLENLRGNFKNKRDKKVKAEVYVNAHDHNFYHI